MNDYTVTLSNNFEADDPIDALAQMVAYAADYAYQAGYRVRWTDDNGEEQSVFIDAEKAGIS